MKKLFYIFLLMFSLSTYAQSVPTDWAKIGLKGKVKSVKTSIYFAEAKDNDFIKGTPFSQGIYPPEKIKQYSENGTNGGKSFFHTFFSKYYPFGYYL